MGKAHNRKTRSKRYSLPEAAYVIRCAPGLASIATQELRFRPISSRKKTPHVLFQRNHDLLFLRFIDSAEGLGLLRIAEQVLRCLAFGRFKISRSQLGNVAAYLRGRGEAYRVVVTVEGRQFARQELKRWIADELQRRDVYLDEQAEQILWVFCIDEAFYIGVEHFRAEAVPLRSRRKRERKGALPLTIAAAMAFLAIPNDGETILDPMCGSGTLLAEAAAYRPDVSLLGLDLDPSAIKAATANLDFAQQKTLKVGDATKTALPVGSVDIVLVNLPFGKQYGDRGYNPLLYTNVLKEMLRLAAPDGWRAVVLTADTEALDHALTATPRLAVARQVDVSVLGEPAKIVLLKRSGK